MTQKNLVMILMILMKNESFKHEVNVFRKNSFEGVILKKYFLGDQFWQCIFFRDQFWKCIFWESNFENILFDGINGVLTDCAWERGWIKKMDVWDANKQYMLLKYPISPDLVLRVSKSFVISFLRLETSISWNIRIYFSWWIFLFFRAWT